MIEFLVEKINTGTTTAGKLYATLKLRDKEGSSIEGKIWDFDPNGYDFITTGSVVIVDGVVNKYQGVPQLKICSIRPSSTPPQEYFIKSKFDTEMLYDKIIETVELFDERLTRKVTMGLLEKFTKQEILTAPAATSVHNNWCGGLVEHIWSMLQLSKDLVQWYKVMYCSKISSDKVEFGIIAHDLGKIREYDINNPGYPKTTSGVLVNHLVLGPAMVYQVGMEAIKANDNTVHPDDEMELNHLMHIVSSHHGQLEWGSPVKPSTLEAIIVHHLDLIDSKMLHAIKLMEEPDAQNNLLSKWSRFENIQFVRPK